jgi:REP element-mobilizing transposase RayT
MRARGKARGQVRQLGLFRHGGKRKGAGRKPRGTRARMPHDKKPALNKRDPVHVTLRLRRALPNLRQGHLFKVLRRSIRESGWRASFQVVHYSVQNDHVHLICEALDERGLSRGVQGLCVRIARGLNRIWKRQGSVFDDRFHASVLTTPREVHHALLYLFANARKHGHKLIGLDPFSSASTFDGWRGRAREARDAVFAVVPRTWALVKGWKWHGLLDPDAAPGRSLA